MKTSKKLFAVLLSICILMNAAISSVMAFSDVTEETPDKTYITALSDKGIIKGVSTESFAPDELCTREQFLTFLYRAAGEPDAGKDADFSDVKDNDYFKNAVTWAHNNEITNGAGEGKFGVGKTLDRNLASFYLYKWALATENGNLKESCYLTEYEDGADVALFARTSYAWAVGDGVIVPDGKKLDPKALISRGWAAAAIGRLVEEHYHKWSEYKDNGDGTHTRVCERDASHVETAKHTYNNGELTKEVTKTQNGEITYTCTACHLTKKEVAPKGTEVITRKDLEEAVVQTAWAYYIKGARVQYDSTHFSRRSGYYGGICRLTAETPPEYATTGSTFYMVCSDFVHQAYIEALNMHPISEIDNSIGLATKEILRYSDNQRETTNGEEKLNEPLNDNDKDGAVVRWIDYDNHTPARINELYNTNTLESTSFYDNFPGLVFKDDGPDGAPHYAYYDESGKKLTMKEVKDRFITPYLEEHKKNLRVGDLFVDSSHAMLYTGNDTIIHCSLLSGIGGKIDQATPRDRIETVGEKIENGEAGGYEYTYFGNGAMFIHYDIIKARANRDDLTFTIFARPFDQLVEACLDEDPGNDIINMTIPEETKSRMKYPIMDINRNVDATVFGTAVKGGELTYTIDITNHTNDERFKLWYARLENGKSGEETYKNLKVTEKIPAGVKVKADTITAGGKLSGDTITWNLDTVSPGEKVTLSYTVEVTGEIGDVIVAGGGFVDNIPSNIIRTTIGGEKLDADQKAKLLEIGAGGEEGLKEFGKDSEFAENIYKELGKEIDLPSIREITDNLFTYQGDIGGQSLGGLADPAVVVSKLFIRQTEVPEAFEEAKSMIVDRYWGGSRFYVGKDRKGKATEDGIREFRKEYLEVGDILVYEEVIETDDRMDWTYQPKRTTVMVYDGEKLLSAEDLEGKVTYSVYEGEALDTQLLKGFMKAPGKEECHLFYMLRPSQAK